MHDWKNQIRTIIRSFSVFGKICVGKLCARIPALLASVTILLGTLIFFYAKTTLATPAFVQGNSAVPQISQTSVTLPYAAAQAAGDLNVVVIGWNDTAAQITSVADSAGNTYYLAAGPTLLSGAASQAIYYASNIASSRRGNTVTVTFSSAAKFPDLRIVEYSGVDANNPLDGSAAAANTGGMTASSGAVGTTNAEDLLVAADCVQT